MNATDLTSLMIKGLMLVFFVFTGMIPVEKSPQQLGKPRMKAWIVLSHEDDFYTYSGWFLSETNTDIFCTYQSTN